MPENSESEAERRASINTLNLAREHMIELFDRAMGLAKESEQWNDRAKEIFNDLKKVENDLDMKVKYQRLFEQLKAVIEQSQVSLKREEDRQEISHILLEMDDLIKKTKS